jgi:hypothetical protein
MISPLRNSPDRPDSSAHYFRPSGTPDRERPQQVAGSRPDAAAGADDLARLESSIQWIKHEGMLARLEAGHRPPEEIRKLPRAALLPPVSGIPPVDIEGSGRRRETSTSLLPPPPVGARVQVQLPRRRHRHGLRGALYLLIATVIAGAIAYHVSGDGLLSAWQPAQAASLQAR